MNIPIVVVILIGALIIGVIIRYILLSKESAEEKVRYNELRAQLAKEQEKYIKVEAELSDKNAQMESLKNALSKRLTPEEEKRLVDKANSSETSSKKTELALQIERETTKQQAKQIANLSGQVGELNSLLSLRPSIEEKAELEQELLNAKNRIETNTQLLEQSKKETSMLLSSLHSIFNPEGTIYISKGSEESADYDFSATAIIKLAQKVKNELQIYKSFYENAQSNLTLFPYMAGIVAEFETRDIEELARKLDWGYNIERLKKIVSIQTIRHDAQMKIEQAKVAEYQLAYLLQLFPSLKDLLEYEYAELPKISTEDLSEHDASRDYLSKEEWDSLSTTERNQLALDRYVASRKKTNWQVGRDYEEYVGYRYRQLGYSVDNFGAYMGLDDLGRDVIAKKGSKTYIIQCKYWSQKKEIHENHINQLFGTVTSYKIENNVSDDSVIGVLITNTQLSDRAKKFANRLHIEYKEHYELGDFPRIKCNIGHSEWGSKIYHLPFDQQYDAAKICNPGEFYALTVAEAERAGFRRAFKWHGA